MTVWIVVVAVSVIVGYSLCALQDWNREQHRMVDDELRAMHRVVSEDLTGRCSRCGRQR